MWGVVGGGGGGGGVGGGGGGGGFLRNFIARAILGVHIVGIHRLISGGKDKSTKKFFMKEADHHEKSRESWGKKQSEFPCAPDWKTVRKKLCLAGAHLSDR